MKLCKAEGARARLGTLSVCVWHESGRHRVSARVMTETLGDQGAAWGWRVAWGPGDDRLVPGCPVVWRFLEVMPGCEWFLGSSRVRMGVNPKGIVEGVAARPKGEHGPGGRQLSGPETPLEFQALGTGLLEKSFLSLPGHSALVPCSGLRREMGEGKPPPLPPGSPSSGEQDKKLDGG